MKGLVLAVLLGLAVADRPVPSNGYGAPPPSPSNGYGAPQGGYGVDPEIAALTENIPGGGVPGEDYPILASVPDTGFDCDAQDVPGYYADTDPEAGCQVFHICQDRARRRQKDSFLCPNGTIFNQQYLVCDWWFNFDCADAEDFYSVNEEIGVVPYGKPKNNGYGSNGNGASSNGYGSNGNGASSNGYGSNGNGASSNGYGSNGNGASSNGYGSNGNGASSNSYGSNGNGKKNGNGNKKKSNGRKNGNGAGNGGYGAPAAPSDQYGAPSVPSNSYGAPEAPSDAFGAP